uniref:Uncharacterized protein n=1 Tax=Manihot esculenta TaxID=3983 RepID=A0A2C9V8C1_MANES
MVKMLLTFGCDDESMDRDNDGRNPLHHAVIKGSVEVVIELLRACPESALEVTAQKETIFHLAVKHRVSVSDELFSRLLRGDYTDYLLNLSDKKGNTVLHLASIRKQTQIIRLLTERRPRLDVNAVNSSGLTPLDLLVIDPLNLKDMEIEGIMKSAGGIRLNQSQEQREHLKSIASGLLVMASLIAATSCQFAIFLQGGFWETLSPATDGNVTLISNSTHFRVSTAPGANATAAMQMPGNATASHNEKTRSYLFLAIFDGLAFMLSLCLIFLTLMPTSTNKFSRLKWLSSYLLTLLLMPFLIALFISMVSYRATDTPSTDNFIFNLFLPFLLCIIVLVLIPIVKVVGVNYRSVRR